MRPNRDALGQSLRAGCAVLGVAMLLLVVGTLPRLDSAVQLTVTYAVPPVLLGALFVALVAWSSPRPWQSRTYAAAVGGFAAVLATLLVLAGSR